MLLVGLGNTRVSTDYVTWLGSLDTQDWVPVTFALQALSLVEKAEPVQVCFTLRLRDQRTKWMQDGCKVYMDSYMASIELCFMVTWTIFQKPPLGGRPNTKPGDHGNPKYHNHCIIIIFIMYEDLAWIDLYWNSIWLWGQSHMILHYNWGSVTTLHDFGSVLGQSLDTHSFMVTTPGFCVKWPWAWWVSNSSTILLCGDYTKCCIWCHQFNMSCSRLVVNYMCSVTDTTCKPNINRHFLLVFFKHYRFTMLQIMSLTKWFLIQIWIMHDNISLQNIQDA